MAWEVFNREDSYQGIEKPFVSIATDRINFNTMFAKMAGLTIGNFVRIYVDSDNFKLGFEFLTENESDTFRLTATNAVKVGKKGCAVNCGSLGLNKKHDWLMAVAKLSDVRDKRFVPKKEGKFWTIQVCPAFETRKARESKDIPSELSGIYRYLREDGEIVYIGRGSIKLRLDPPERKDWVFDVIEYSKLDNPDQQVKWETYWIERYKDRNNGKLPYYNKISGREVKNN